VILSTEILLEKHFVRCWIILLFFKSRKLDLHLDQELRIRITLIWIRIQFLIALNRVVKSVFIIYVFLSQDWKPSYFIRCSKERPRSSGLQRGE